MQIRLQLARSRAFTLVELLTVLAILGILIAILVPVLGKVRAGAKSSRAVSNLRQIGIAAHVYAQENKVYPDGILPSFAGTWDGLLAPYVSVPRSAWNGWGGSNSSVFEDPARGIIPPPPPPGNPSVACTFSANPVLFPDRAGSSAPLIRPENVLRPSHTVLVLSGAQKADGYAPALLRGTYEVFDSNPANGNQPVFDNAVADGDSGDEAWPAYRHAGKALGVMADGSVRGFHVGGLRRQNFSPYY